MLLQEAIQGLLLQLRDVLERLDDQQYTRRIEVLSDGTIGQHVRHMLEFLQELQRGYDRGMVDYDRRDRSLVLETRRDAGILLLMRQIGEIDRPEKELVLAAHVGSGEDDPVMMPTHYSRELLYNIEHIVHHMALLRVGIAFVSPLRLSPEFGVAASTLKYRQRCAS